MEKQIHQGSGRRGKSGSIGRGEEDKNEEMVGYIELREGMRRGGGEVGEDKRKSRRKKSG